MRIAIHVQREIARLILLDPRQSNSSIAGPLGISKTTVGKLRKLVREVVEPWERLSQLDDDEWVRTLGTEDRSVAQPKEAPDWSLVHQEMQKPDSTLRALWTEWRGDAPNGVAYSQFAAGYRAYKKSLHVVMRQAHVPGQNMFVDFAGRRVEIKDRNGGPSVFAHLFVAALGYSSLVYCELVPTQEVRHWLQCHANAFEAYGGVPQYVVCDNLKAAVWRRERGYVVINPDYRAMLAHYQSAPRPARPYRPKDKAKAEVHVQIVQRQVLFVLRNTDFFDIAEANKEIQRLVAVINERPLTKSDESRLSRFEQVEKTALRPLPSERYEPCTWRYQVLVGADHHIDLGGAFYSVPHQLTRQVVDARITASRVEVLHKGKRVALHSVKQKGEVSTVDDHRPPSHKAVLEGEPKELTAWAESVGPAARAVFKYHLETRSDLVNGIKAACKLRRQAATFSASRLEDAFTYALKRNIFDVKSLLSIIKNAPDRAAGSSAPHRPSHLNLRGPDYYTK